jgi:HK97 gp10 family phage protein
MAMFEASVKILGLKELDAALAALPDEVAGPIMQAALEEGGDVIRRAAADNIHSRSGATAADIRVEIQVKPEEQAGVAGIGGTKTGRTGRQHVLRWLEFGTKPHVIVGGAEDRRQAKKAQRALRSIGNRDAAAALRKALRGGTVTTRHALKFGGIFRHAVHHPGIQGQSPLTRALAESGDRAIKVFADTLWSGIRDASQRLKGT